MYFAGLIRLDYLPKPLLVELDKFLKKRCSSMSYFTPETIAREMNITEDMAWELAFSAMNIGVINKILIKQCIAGKKIFRKKDIPTCSSCEESGQLKEGYYFIVR